MLYCQKCLQTSKWRWYMFTCRMLLLISLASFWKFNENERKWRTSCISFCGCVKGSVSCSCVTQLLEVMWGWDKSHEMWTNIPLCCMHHAEIFINLEVRRAVMMAKCAIYFFFFFAWNILLSHEMYLCWTMSFNRHFGKSFLCKLTTRMRVKGLCLAEKRD